MTLIFYVSWGIPIKVSTFFDRIDKLVGDDIKVDISEQYVETIYNATCDTNTPINKSWKVGDEKVQQFINYGIKYFITTHSSIHN